jgi:sec-independent protein translocase protein TatB
VLDIGMPEFAVIAIVALVVLGPERLPELMRRIGQFYRQARELASQYTSEAQRMFDEGMREVEDVSATVNSAWQDGAGAGGNQPPPRLRQLPPPLQAPTSQADAGPWLLAGPQRDSANDVESRPAVPAVTPFTLTRQAPPEIITTGFSSISSSPPLPPAPPEDALIDVEAANDLVATPPAIPDIPQIPAAAPPHQPAVPATETPVTAPNASGPSLDRPPATPATANGTAARANGATGSGTPDGESGDRLPAGPSATGDTTRERTVIELYLQGDLTWQKAAEFLGLSPEAFLDRVEQVRRSAPLPPARR